MPLQRSDVVRRREEDRFGEPCYAVITKGTNELLGHVWRDANIDYRRKGSRFGTKGQAFIESYGWHADDAGGNPIYRWDDTLEWAIKDVLDHHNEKGSD